MWSLGACGWAEPLQPLPELGHQAYCPRQKYWRLLARAHWVRMLPTASVQGLVLLLPLLRHLVLEVQLQHLLVLRRLCHALAAGV